MSLLIKGMGLPTYGATNVLILQNGEVYGVKYWSDKWELLGQAIELPPHGRLIDKDALEADISASVVFSGRNENAEIVGAKKIINRLHIAPTIIPAEEDE